MTMKSVYIIAAVVFLIMTFSVWGERSKRLWGVLFAALAVASGYLAYSQMQPPSAPNATLDMPDAN